MPTVIYIQPDGAQASVPAILGSSVMQTATANRVRGIVAECGGAAMCATCHVYVDDAFLDRFPKMTDAEDAMLDSAACERTRNSRLSCQLVIEAAHEGLVIRLPERQT